MQCDLSRTHLIALGRRSIEQNSNNFARSSFDRAELAIILQFVLEIKKCPSVTSRPVVYFSVVPKSSPEGILGEPRSIRLQ